MLEAHVVTLDLIMDRLQDFAGSGIEIEFDVPGNLGAFCTRDPFDGLSGVGQLDPSVHEAPRGVHALGGKEPKEDVDGRYPIAPKGRGLSMGQHEALDALFGESLENGRGPCDLSSGPCATVLLSHRDDSFLLVDMQSLHVSYLEIT
jgi:hypothetical protein